MKTLDVAEPIVSFAGPANNVTIGNPPQVGFGIASWITNTLFDVSAWDSWTIFGQVVNFGGAPGLVTLQYYDQLDPNLSRSSLVAEQNVFLPTAAQAAVGAGFMIVGRFLGPVVEIDLVGAGGTYRLDILGHNRTRIYDTPYTPAALGQFLANFPLQTVAANNATLLDLPYYMGPARLALSTAAGPAAGRARVIDNNNSLVASTNGDLPQADFWLPGITNTATGLYRLRIDNDVAAPSAIGASVIAA